MVSGQREGVGSCLGFGGQEGLPLELGGPDRRGEGGGDDEDDLQQEITDEHDEELGHLVGVRGEL